MLFSVVSCTLTHIEAASETLQQFGSAESTQSFLLELNDGEELAETSLHTVYEHIITSHQIHTQEVSDQKINVTVTLFFDGLPGEARYAVKAVVKSEDGAVYANVAEQMHSVYGIAYVSFEENEMKILSGDYGKGLVVSAANHDEEEPIRLQAISHAPDGVQVEATAHVVNNMKNRVLSSNDVNVLEGGLEVEVHAQRLGASLEAIESRNIVVDGESFETALVVTVEA
ncbi:hypothetical protein FGB62_143g02 [Gracilaria domingensis]|nr:hypothetical protein FGB62_143g02 [Gracilaria domingensis]